MLLLLMITVHVTVIGHRHSNVEHQQDHPGKTAQIHSAFVHCEICAYHFSNDADNYVQQFHVEFFKHLEKTECIFLSKGLSSLITYSSDRGPPNYYC